MVLLKESLQGSAENTIKGIKSIPANYNWMIETLKKRFSSHPVIRSKIFKRLFDLPHACKNADRCCHHIGAPNGIRSKNQNVDNITIEELLDIQEKEIAAKAYVELLLGCSQANLQPNQRQGTN
ncbi:hypothetical protein OESDEN_20244 [Oesophagostomum dentatum]|uniref:Uncharacterized protein n=1 Tax=Oesophagostomum dentatum TaxID=61180 RepID=A0A0B1SA48_OESDE|nr:hypothetical protein OESDEN_20244 [Oesophagostomum dentatum]